MMDFDPGLMQDFLTESAELIEALDGDLVKLESTDDEQRAELLNACFRALHTIKGAASFLGLTRVIEFAHVAEDALNKLRKGEACVTPEVMDALLQSADVVRAQIEALSAGEEAGEAPAELVAQLQSIVEGRDAARAVDATDNAAGGADAAEIPEAETLDDDLPGVALTLPPQKADLVEYMAADLQEYAGQLDDIATQLTNDASRDEGAASLAEVADNLSKTADFFELDDLTAAVNLLVTLAPAAGMLDLTAATEAAVRVRAIGLLIVEQSEWMLKSRVLNFPLETLASRLQQLAAGEALEPEATTHQGDPNVVLVLDGVRNAQAPTANDVSNAPAAVAPDAGRASTEKASTPAPGPSVTDEAGSSEDAKSSSGAGPKVVAEATIRVEVSRLESLLNMVGQLVSEQESADESDPDLS